MRSTSCHTQLALVDAADTLMATGYTVGTGSGQPTGVVQALLGGASKINTTGSEAIVVADPYALQAALPPRLDPPPPIPDEAAFKLQALDSAYASASVQAAFLEVNHAARRFALAADQVRYARGHLEGQEAVDAYQELDAARAAVHSAVEELANRTNTELGRASASD